MKINGAILFHVQNDVGEFPVYRVILRGGPGDGMETTVMNTTICFHSGHIYRLNENGDFTFDSSPVKESQDHQ